MPSFDIVSEVNHVEIRNAVDQCNKEVTNRFDFKGSDARVEIDEKEKTLIVFADDEFKLRQVRDVLTGKLAKRGVDIRALDAGKMEAIGGDKMKETIKVREGIEQERAKTVVKLLKDSKLKVQASIQGDAGARLQRQEGHAAGSDRAGAQVGDRLAAAVQELPRLEIRDR